MDITLDESDILSEVKNFEPQWGFLLSFQTALIELISSPGPGYEYRGVDVGNILMRTFSLFQMTVSLEDFTFIMKRRGTNAQKSLFDDSLEKEVREALCVSFVTYVIHYLILRIEDDIDRYGDHIFFLENDRTKVEEEISSLHKEDIARDESVNTQDDEVEIPEAWGIWDMEMQDWWQYEVDRYSKGTRQETRLENLELLIAWDDHDDKQQIEILKKDIMLLKRMLGELKDMKYTKCADIPHVLVRHHLPCEKWEVKGRSCCTLSLHNPMHVLNGVLHPLCEYTFELVKRTKGPWDKWETFCNKLREDEQFAYYSSLYKMCRLRFLIQENRIVHKVFGTSFVCVDDEITRDGEVLEYIKKMTPFLQAIFMDNADALGISQKAELFSFIAPLPEDAERENGYDYRLFWKIRDEKPISIVKHRQTIEEFFIS